jgi:hypothetical protein
MTLDLTELERVALVRALGNYLEMLTAEASRTEDRSAEHDLWALRDQIEKIRGRLQTATKPG